MAALIDDPECWKQNVRQPLSPRPDRESRRNNVSVFSTNARRMEIVFFDQADALQPPSVIHLEGHRPLRRPFRETVIYEMHVGGFTTRHPKSGVTPANQGTYARIIEKIPHLQALGITAAVELLPVFQLDAQAAPSGLTNYWGYTPCHFSDHSAYSSSKDPLICLDEFRNTVKELNRAGIEVLQDVFSRGDSGEAMMNPPIVWDIYSDPGLAGAKLIAEAWDAGGLYQVGSFGQADEKNEWAISR